METATDKERLTELFERHYNEVLAYCARRIGRDDADDAAAEVFAVACRRLDEIDWETGRPWLYGIARRVLANRWRSRWRRNRLTQKMSSLGVTYAEAADFYLVRNEEGQAVLDALDTLRPGDREILRLRAWEDLTTTEIALVLNITIAAAEKRLQRATHRLGQVLGSLNHSEMSPRAAEEGGG